MAVAAVLATALNTAAVRPKGLWVGGVDVLKATSGAWGVPIETISITENGPGAVSNMSFTIDDPQIQVLLADGMDVRYQDIATDQTLFYGWVDHYDVIPDFGDQGRSIVVSVVGIETLLDWSILSAQMTIAAGMLTTDAIQSVLAFAYGSGSIRGLAGTGATQSTQALPIASSPAYVVTEALSILTGTTVREAIRQVIAASALAGTAAPFVVTVDFYGGLRVFNPAFSSTIDYADVTIPAGAVRAERLVHSVEAASARAVIVVGTGVTAFVSDGTGLAGPAVRLDDTTITTATAARAAGIAYLAQYAAGTRGNYERQDHIPTANVHPGSIVNITNTQIGIAPGTPYRIGSITKSFNPSGRENWKITYGLLPPSLTRLIRRFTRSTLS